MTTEKILQQAENLEAESNYGTAHARVQALLSNLNRMNSNIATSCSRNSS